MGIHFFIHLLYIILYINYTLFFLISAQNIDCGYSLEPPRRGCSNEYPQSMFLSRNKEKISEFLSENFRFFSCKIFSIFE